MEGSPCEGGETAPSPCQGEGWGEGGKRTYQETPPSPCQGEGWGEGGKRTYQETPPSPCPSLRGRGERRFRYETWR